MSAEAQANAEADAVADAARRVYRYLTDGIESIGGIVVAAGLCGMRHGDLRRALDRGDRYVSVENAMAIGTRLRTYNATLATKLSSALVEPIGFEVFPRVVIDDKERADRYERIIRQLPMGEQIIADVIGGRR